MSCPLKSNPFPSTQMDPTDNVGYFGFKRKLKLGDIVTCKDAVANNRAHGVRRDDCDTGRASQGPHL